MRLAVCDDEPAARDELAGLLRTWAEREGFPVEVACYATAEDFLTAARSTFFDAVFMDVYLGDDVGTQVVASLGDEQRCRTVFVTTSLDHAIEAYGLRAAHYLVKPVTPEAVAEALARCLPNDAPRTLNVRTATGPVPVPEAAISYIEVRNKVCELHTDQGLLRTYTSLDALTDALDPERFLRVQRSFIVNMARVSLFGSGSVEMDDGAVISLSRGNRTELRERYQRFLFAMARGLR